MSAFDDRKKALENKFFHDEERKFRLVSRRRKLLGLWAAHQLHLGEEESLKYAIEIVKFGVEHPEDGAVVSRIKEDLDKAGLEISEEAIREEMDNLQTVALQQLEQEGY